MQMELGEAEGKVMDIDFEVDSEVKDTPTTAEGEWKPLPALPPGERAVLVLAANSYQATLEKHDVKFHIQWELQRIIARYPSLSWDDFHADDTEPLWDISASDASRRIHEVVERVYKRKPKPDQSEKDPSTLLPRFKGSRTVSDREARLLAEVDREEQSIRAGNHEGLLSDDATWPHGGRISYIIEVSPVENRWTERGLELVPIPSPTQASPPFQDDYDKTTPDLPYISNPSPVVKSAEGKTLPFTMELKRAEMSGKSTKLARRFGSRRIIAFKYKTPRKASEREALLDLFRGRQFVLFGRVYVAVWSPPDRDSIWAVEVGNSEFDRFESLRSKFEPPMPTFSETLAIFNNLVEKPSQAMPKWASRPQLLFSDSVPAARLHPSEIQVIDDIVVAGLSGPPTTEQTLTDGCGLMTEALARRIGARLLPSKGRPFVVQIRLGGAKGLLALMTGDQEAQYPGKSVILRQSMAKSISKSLDPSLFIIDVLQCGGDIMRYGASISGESIICLNHGGVPSTLILEMGKLKLDQLRLDLHPNPQEGETPESAIKRLQNMVYRYGGVGLDRDKRECAKQGKSMGVAGLVSRHMESTDDQDDTSAAMADTIESSERCDIDPVSGQPGMIGESLYMALTAGFHPSSSDYSMKKLKTLVGVQIDKLVNDCRIQIDQSVSAFIVPDSLGILAPDEIFCAFSGAGPIDPETRCPISHLMGPVLVYRSPCKLPTDIRKFKAVYHPELSHLKDCIIMSASSTLCERSPASYLSGGDYDGDTATVVYDPRLVNEFHDADDQYAIPPDTFEAENFEKGLVKGTDFLAQLKGAEDDAVIRNYQTFLLGSILDEKLTGTYSIMHDAAVYTLRYDHPETIRLARMYCLVLDARKSGLKVKPEVLRNDRKLYSGKVKWQAARKKKGDTGLDDPVYVNRPGRLRGFIMDQLQTAAAKHGAEIKDGFHDQAPNWSVSDFQALAQTYQWECQRRKDGMSSPLRVKQLDTLERHVSTCIEVWYRRIILCPKKSIEQHYLDYRPGAKYALRGGPISIFSPKDDQQGIMLQAQMRALARVWRDMLPLHEVDELCRNVHEQRILLISCAAAKLERKDQSFLFDVDFETTCSMNAKQKGQTSTVTLDSMLMLKPNYKEKR